MAKKLINYYLTPVSPWTYLGAARFRKIAEAADADVNVHLVDYGTIFPQTGGLPLPKRAPERLAYRMADLKRFRDFLGIPLVAEPQYFPSKTRLSTYAIMAVIEHAGHYAGLHAAEAVLAGLWAEDKDMDSPQDLTTQLDSVTAETGMSAAEILTFAEENSAQYDAKITADTQQALAENVFGAPSYVVDGEVFWGQDRLDLLAWRLGIEK